MTTQYSIVKEIKNTLSVKRILIWILLMLWPFLNFMLQRNNYSFRDKLDVFTFMLEGVLPLVFVLLATLVYLGSFSQEIKKRFLVYTRLRIPLRKMLRIKFAANFLLTFGAFFVFTFGYFLFSFYIAPILGLIQYHPEVYKLNEVTVVEDSYTRHTFTQLLQYGSLTYGFLYSCWVGLNAAVYAALGFFMVLIVRSQFLALSIPFLLYIVGSFVLGAAGLMHFRFPDAIFPYSYMQVPIWTAFVPFLFLIFICVIIYIYVNKRLEWMDNVI
ncbi:hypothetical protein [Paenibacillus sp. IHBB 10380]|uniref:hypothetical protein n=1 Tax=Paenibacillus sp. IHBB 10380 TaxID=1566358 RepID=UPI000696080D|nr:hypothetical protein [Paenibacillus sp. IHBB 10380]